MVACLLRRCGAACIKSVLDLPLPSSPCRRVHDALENAPRAVKWYRAALKADPFNYEVIWGVEGGV